MTGSLDLTTLAALVAAEVAGQTGLGAKDIRVEYVLNWGGFAAQSFRIDDGRRQLHLKLSDQPDGTAALAAWYRIHGDLSERYRAPPVIDWFRLGDWGYQGLLFPFLEGTTLTTWDQPLRQAVATLLGTLHSDRELAARAFPNQLPGTCEAGYHSDFHRRFTDDLVGVAAERPDFVSRSTFGWMEGEAARLAELVANSAPFSEPAGTLIHGDVWPNNVLMMPNGQWYLLDWDDHRLGDPVLDLAKLLDRASAAADPPAEGEINALLGPDPARRARFDLYSRAIALDWVIDSLADFIEARQAPEHAGVVRPEKKRRHLEALAWYRVRYPG